MNNPFLITVEQAAWHRVMRRVSQLELYPQAIETLKSLQTVGGGKGKGGNSSRHQVSNLMSLSLAARSPNDILQYLDHQAKRSDPVVSGFNQPLVAIFNGWKNTFVPRLVKETLAHIGTPEAPAKALLHLTPDGLLLEVFRAFCQHIRAQFDQNNASSGGNHQ